MVDLCRRWQRDIEALVHVQVQVEVRGRGVTRVDGGRVGVGGRGRHHQQRQRLGPGRREGLLLAARQMVGRYALYGILRPRGCRVSNSRPGSSGAWRSLSRRGLFALLPAIWGPAVVRYRVSKPGRLDELDGQHGPSRIRRTYIMTGRHGCNVAGVGVALYGRSSRLCRRMQAETEQ